MTELQKIQPLLEQAKRAADAGNLALADALLQDVARIQESELGPSHPELANTVNNLAVVAEMEGRLRDAETYYRRAVAMASAALPPDDPMVASSRKNLEEFCRERGVPFDPLAVVPAGQLTQADSGGLPHDRTGTTPANVAVTDLDVAAPALQSVADTRSVTAPVPGKVDPAAGRSSARARSLAIVAIGLVVLAAVALLVTRGMRESPREQHAAPAAAPAAEPATPPSAGAAPAPIEQKPPPKVASRDEQSAVGAGSHSAPERTAGGMTLVTAQLCRTLSVGKNWRCDAVDQSVGPGPIVLYTRVKSAHEAVVIHRWYRGDTLRKSARLTVLANTTDGYRTYSRQTVKSGEDWRVEVRNTSGDLLYEQRVSVR